MTTPVLDQDLYGKSADTISIDTLQAFCPAEGYYFANSFGKDSTVLRDLLLRSGVPFDAHHNLTTLDPPELTQFGKRCHPETAINKPEKSFWQHIRAGCGLPMRQSRWCCRELKERGGNGRTVVTGVRAAESARRATYTVVTHCLRHGKNRVLVAPILHWTDEDVWTYIRRRELPYCSLYDEGFKRLGCVMCPMGGRAAEEAARWPKLRDGLLRAITHAYPNQIGWQKYGSPEAVLDWWLNKPFKRDDESQQCFAFDQFGGEE